MIVQVLRPFSGQESGFLQEEGELAGRGELY